MVLHGVFYWSGTTKFQVTDWRPAMIKLSVPIDDQPLPLSWYSGLR